jgi:hypothetical protein
MYTQAPQQMYTQQSNVQSQIQMALQEQQRGFQEELNKLKMQLVVQQQTQQPQPQNLGIDLQSQQAQQNQNQLLTYELTQQKLINTELQNKLKILANSQDIDDSKFKLLEEKRIEILSQVDNLKKKYEETERQMLESKKLNEDVKKLIKNNLEIYNSNDKIEILNLEHNLKSGNIYTCPIITKMSHISAIELVNYSLPELIYNITPHNNILYYSTNENNQITCSDDIFYQKKGNIKILGLPVGNYTADYLVEIMNKVLNQDNIDIKINQGNNFITIGKISGSESIPLTLYTDYSHYQNNILEIFGFETKQECSNGSSFTSKKSYDLRSDKVVQIFLTNINDTQPLCKIMLGSNRINSYMQKLSSPLNELNNLQIEIKDSKGRPIYFGDKSITLEISLKGLVQKIPTLNTDKNANVIPENSLYDQINSLY